MVDTIFFGTTGTTLTSTSAEHIANLAKEFVRGRQRDLEGLRFTEKVVHALGQAADTSVLERGIGEAELGQIADKLAEIGKANSLIAWLREGIKAKNDYLDAVKTATYADYCAWEGKTYEPLEEPDKADYLSQHGFDEKPEDADREDDLTESELVALWLEADRLRYATLTDTVALLDEQVKTLGRQCKLVQDSTAADPKESRDCEGQLLSVSQERPTIAADKLLAAFNHYVGVRDGLKAELDVYKERLAKEAAADHDQKELAYTKESNDCWKQQLAYDELDERFYYDALPAYRQQKANRDNELRAYRIKKAKEVGDLKIVIPASLLGIYSKVSSLGR